MARNPMTEGRFVSVLQAVDTSGANPAATTISAVRQIRRVVSAQMWPGTPGDPTHVVRPSSGTDMLGNIVYLHSTTLAGSANATTDNYWVTVQI